jgi:hypothetical protein
MVGERVLARALLAPPPFFVGGFASSAVGRWWAQGFPLSWASLAQP